MVYHRVAAKTILHMSAQCAAACYTPGSLGVPSATISATSILVGAAIGALEPLISTTGRSGGGRREVDGRPKLWTQVLHSACVHGKAKPLKWVCCHGVMQVTP